MLADEPRRTRTPSPAPAPSWGRRLAWAAAVAAVITAMAVPVPSAAGRLIPGMTLMSYRGYTFQVPISWPVIDVSGRLRTCVRFDRHAIYLGAPGIDQACPSSLVGTTEALLIQPASAPSPRSATENPVARQIIVTARGIRITATFDAHPAEIGRILASAALPAPVAAMPRPAVLAGGPRRRVSVPPELPAGVTDYHGLGFDTCAAPSQAYLRAWRSQSPYRAIGIYIGGADRACDQPNLTPGWLSGEAAAGWRFIPLYVGPQAAYGELSSPARQGTAAAADAVLQAQQLGFGPRTPLYYDMEGYRPGETVAALRFLSAWTAGLHALGYASGVYSSSLSGISDLASRYFSGRYSMPDVSYDALWNGSAGVSDPVYRPGEWTPHRRLHQYSGNVLKTYGGDTIDIDQDYLDVDLPAAGGTPQASQAVQQPDGAVDVFYRGADHRLWRVSYRPKAGWARPVDMGGSVQSAPTAVLRGPGRVDVFYQGTGGGLWQAAEVPGHGWRPVRRLPAMGVLGGAPRAVARPGGAIDVLWKGSADRQLWVGQFSPGHGWSRPKRLGGSLAASPSPVVSPQGNLEAFWKGTDGSLWEVTGAFGASWTAPVRLGLGPVGGPPAATAAPGGTIDVAWTGSGRHRLWLASLVPGGRWSKPRDLGGNVSLSPTPVASAPGAGAVRVFWRGVDARLWLAVHRTGVGWRPAARTTMRMLDSAPFVSVGSSGKVIHIFWRSPAGVLWSAALRRGGALSGPVRLGGREASTDTSRTRGR